MRRREESKGACRVLPVRSSTPAASATHTHTHAIAVSFASVLKLCLSSHSQISTTSGSRDGRAWMSCITTHTMTISCVILLCLTGSQAKITDLETLPADRPFQQRPKRGGVCGGPSEAREEVPHPQYTNILLSRYSRSEREV